jgi:hypothetical protein
MPNLRPNPASSILIVADIHLDCRWTLEAVQQARTHWVKLAPGDGRYRAFKAEGDLGKPEWPEDLDRRTVLARTFNEDVIRTRDHDVVLESRGLKRR